VRTRDSTDEMTQLPPPPAPPARDANPWPLPGSPRTHRLPSIRRPRGRDASTRPAREGMRNLVAVAVVAFIVVSGVLEALQGGGPESIVGLVVPLFILAILFLARRRKSNRLRGTNRTAGIDDT
jgi:hypothetical protein